MSKPEGMESGPAISRLLRQAIAFVRDFAAFAGASGVLAAALAVIAAAFEGVGLLLLVPLLSVVTSSDNGPGWTHRLLAQAFDVAGAQTRTARLSLLLGLFAVLIVVRAIVVARRNIMLLRIEVGFIDTVRARLARRLAAAPWPVVSRLQHARVTQLMSGDIHRVGTAAHYMVQFAAALVIIGAQIIIAFLLAPLLTAVALLLIAVGAAVGYDFVAGLPAGLDTVLGERGTLISGGERQRLCLARAVLRRPFLLVLDEATSAIDVPAERKIIKAMLDLKPRPTIVMIAHRDQSLAYCDRLLRLQNGSAVAGEPALTS
jgi:ABC-type multidrug transport system fused ATPase/permease subunit